MKRVLKNQTHNIARTAPTQRILLSSSEDFWMDSLFCTIDIPNGYFYAQFMLYQLDVYGQFILHTLLPRWDILIHSLCQSHRFPTWLFSHGNYTAIAFPKGKPVSSEWCYLTKLNPNPCKIRTSKDGNQDNSVHWLSLFYHKQIPGLYRQECIRQVFNPGPSFGVSHNF